MNDNGLIQYQILGGQSNVKGNPIDGDLYDDGYMNADGSNKLKDLSFSNGNEGDLEFSNLFDGYKQRRSGKHDAKMEKRSAKTNIKNARADAKTARGEASKTKAEAKLETAKALGKDDGTAALLASQSGDVAGASPKSKTILYVGIGAGVLVLGIIVFIVLKKKKK